MKLVSLLGLVVVASGCGTKASPKCKAEAEAIGRSLTAANAEPPIAVIEDDDELVTRADLPRTGGVYAPQIRLTATGLTVDEHEVLNTDALVRELSSEKLRYKRTSGPILFYVAPSVPWSRVVEAVSAAARAGFDAPGFVFRHPAPKPTPPPPSAIDAKLMALLAEKGADRATGFTELVTDVVKSCSAMQRGFSRPAEEDDLATAVIASTTRDLIACNCDVDLPSLHALMWHLLWNKNPSRVVVFDPAAPAQTIALAAETPWSEASTQFTPALRNAQLVVR